MCRVVPAKLLATEGTGRRLKSPASAGLFLSVSRRLLQTPVWYAGRVAPWGMFSSFVEKTVVYSLSPGKGAALASAPLASFAGSP